MSKYYVIKIGGHQFKVEEGQELIVDQLALNEGEILDIPEVLLSVDGDKIEIGQPNLENGLKAKVLGNLKGKKIRVSRFKAKSRYDKTKGFRAKQTKIQIITGKVKEEPKKVEVEVEKAAPKKVVKKTVKKAVSSKK